MVRQVVAVVVAVAVVSLVAGPVRAQSAEDKAIAESLYEDGRRLMGEGKYADACAKFEESQRRDPGLGTMLRLGDCYEKLGRLASAWATFREAEAVARRQSDDRIKVARARAQQLDARVPRIEIVVPTENAVPGLAVELDGQKAVLGTRLPVDPGAHLVAAAAPGHEPWKDTVTIAEAAVLTVTVPPLRAATERQTKKTGTTGGAPPGAAPPSPPNEHRPARASRTRRTAALIVGGAGVVALGVGAVFGLKASSDWDAAQPHCDAMLRCDPEGISLHDDADTAATLADVSFGVGAAAVAVGAVLWLTTPSERSTARAAALSVVPVGGGWGLAWEGAF